MLQGYRYQSVLNNFYQLNNYCLYPLGISMDGINLIEKYVNKVKSPSLYFTHIKIIYIIVYILYIYTLSEKRLLISDHIKGPLVAAFRSPLMKALDRSVETLGLWIVTSSVTFIKSANQCSFKLCLIVHLVAVWTLVYKILRVTERVSVSHCLNYLSFLGGQKIPDSFSHRLWFQTRTTVTQANASATEIVQFPE